MRSDARKRAGTTETPPAARDTTGEGGHSPGCAAVSHDDEDSCSCGLYDQATGQGDREALAAVLDEHQWHHTRETHCACGFRTPLAQLSLVGYVNHVADAVLAAGFRRAGTGETTVEWGVRGVLPEPDPEFVWEYKREAAARATARHPKYGGTIVRRERTTYPDRVADWQEVPADE